MWPKYRIRIALFQPQNLHSPSKGMAAMSVTSKKYVTFHRKTRLTENSVLGAFETPNKQGLTAFQTLHKLFSNALQTIRKLLTNAWKAFQTLFKPFANGFQTVWKAFQTLLKPFANASQTLCKCFANPLQTLLLKASASPQGIKRAYSYD